MSLWRLFLSNLKQVYVEYHSRVTPVHLHDELEAIARVTDVAHD